MKGSEQYENNWDIDKDSHWNDENGRFDTNKFRTWEALHDEVPEDKKELARSLHKLAVFIQYTLPGLPSIFAGDEAGVWGYKDPFNRKPFPWDNIDEELYNFYCMMGRYRTEYRELFSDSRNFTLIKANEQKLVYKWNEYLIVVNRTADTMYLTAEQISGKKVVFSLNPDEKLGVISPYGAVMIK